ncbi:hypothetical protein IHE44_0000991 [Lamprotornis superbus]|uniref:XK-related protein n=1 Tax=Lamprotornis superbus TaxID=245042 RepID=A0A835TYA1_9PASS|nr:hypothetical protein IHE44_0000991 [Lamprotornis superbus]
MVGNHMCIMYTPQQLYQQQLILQVLLMAHQAYIRDSSQNTLQPRLTELYFGIFIVLHWCIMTFWIVHCETEFCITKWEEIVFDMVVGIIYIFSWFNVKEGRTRCRLFIYYFVILLENTALSVLWYLYKAPPISDAFAIPALCVVFSSFLTGIVFMLMYYAFFHPNGPRFGQSPSCACEDPAAAFTLPPEVATSTLRSISNNRSVTSERDQKFAERDGCVPVFQVDFSYFDMKQKEWKGKLGLPLCQGLLVELWDHDVS